jgi:HEAT repeat protein
VNHSAPSKEAALKQQVAAILTMADWAQRSNAILELKRSQPAEAFAAVVSLLNSPDEVIRRRAGGTLSRFRDQAAAQAEALAGHLRHNPDPRVRLSCGINLLDVQAPTVDQAYLLAIADADEKVAMLSCWQVAHRSGAEGTRALFTAIANLPWRVRMVACKALINQGTADERVVAALEGMSQEPEAAIHEQEQKEMLETLSEPAFADWAGELELESVENTLAKARAVAAARAGKTGQASSM